MTLIWNPKTFNSTCTEIVQIHNVKKQTTTSLHFSNSLSNGINRKNTRPLQSERTESNGEINFIENSSENYPQIGYESEIQTEGFGKRNLWLILLKNKAFITKTYTNNSYRTAFRKYIIQQ